MLAIMEEEIKIGERKETKKERKKLKSQRRHYTLGSSRTPWSSHDHFLLFI